MKRITQYITLFILLFSVTSCNDWLDVTPASQVPEEDQFKDEPGFRQALIGCYIGLASETLYGKNLSWYVLDVQDGKYDLYPSAQVYPMAAYQYKHVRATPIIDAVWLNAYNIIANANNALKFIEKRSNVLDPISYKVIKGELLAIRAMLHFDLMRIYGYGNLASRTDKETKLTIPYVKEYKKETTEQLSYKKTIDLIVADLKEALDLLKEEDPVTKKHTDDYYDNLNDDGFYSDRTYRLNYFAVKALLARVYMWEGSDASLLLARQEALDVIEDGEKVDLYTWVTNDGISTDLILSTEHIASLNVLTLSDKISGYFKLNFTDTDYEQIKLSEEGVQNIFDESGTGSNADFRGSSKMLYPASNGYYVPLKLAQDRAISGTNCLNRIPLVRISEMYLIVAETYLKGTDVNTTEAAKYLTTLRENRSNFIDISGYTRDQLLTCLTNEYRREFLCEGVTFLYFKRIGEINIPNLSTPMSDETYVWPYPETEAVMGLVQ